MKACKTCLIEKPLIEFHAHPKMKDGHISFCKPCKLEAVRVHRLENLEVYKEKNRIRGRSEERKASARMYKKLDYVMEATNKRNKDWSKNNKEKKNAHKSVLRALANGLLLKVPCKMCGSLKVEAHHVDYSRRLDVMWLCRNHHSQIHREERAISRQEQQ